MKAYAFAVAQVKNYYIRTALQKSYFEAGVRHRLEVPPSTRGAQCGKKRVTQQLLCSKSHDFLAVFALAHSKINKIA